MPNVILYIRYKEPNEKEDTCLQFQGCKKLIPKVALHLRRAGFPSVNIRDCLYTPAEKANLTEVLAKIRCDPAIVRDIDKPIVIGCIR
jgi:hypothetical protein